MKKKKTMNNTGFLILEGALLLLSGFFAFGLIGYITMALVFLAAALLVGVYRLIELFSRKRPKQAQSLKTALTAAVYLALALFFAIEIPIIAGAKTDREPEAPYLIVLGAGVNGRQPSLSLLNRLNAALDYLETYPEARAVLSGGQGAGEDISEAKCMFDWLKGKGIEKERLILEAKSSSTYENLKFSLDIIKDEGGDPSGPTALVSSEYHLYRAKYMAGELGAEPLGVAAETTKPLLKVNYFIREAAAVLAMWIM
ncbi:MAG: YdcF family protein [Clostridiales bacterium]|nr:YdcF family protein [Clostridiales bacterium]